MHSVPTLFSQQMSDELVASSQESQPICLQFDVGEHLRDRYGYDVYRKPSWSPSLHVSGRLVGDVDEAKGRLLLKTITHPIILTEAIENFCNVLANQNVRVGNLPPAWDLRRLQLQIPGLRLSLGTNLDNNSLYTISSTTAVQGHWVICLQDATTVLQIYRNGWTTLDTIVQELVFRGIPFNTGVVSASDPSPEIIEGGYRSKGLGLRPVGYNPGPDDYNAYLSARTDVFRSPFGRAALLRGGVVARLARDTVGVSEVLSGPEPSTSVMLGTVGGVSLVDDQLSDYFLDVISGVYYVKTEINLLNHQHLSWWPKDGVWRQSGYFTEEWSADAETWYQDRLKSIKSGSARLYNSTEWKSKLRRYKTSTRALLTEHRRLSASVIDDHLSSQHQ